MVVNRRHYQPPAMLSKLYVLWNGFHGVSSELGAFFFKPSAAKALTRRRVFFPVTLKYAEREKYCFACIQAMIDAARAANTANKSYSASVSKAPRRDTHNFGHEYAKTPRLSMTIVSEANQDHPVPRVTPAIYSCHPGDLLMSPRRRPGSRFYPPI